jgi:hypothetical protein
LICFGTAFNFLTLTFSISPFVSTLTHEPKTNHRFLLF